MLCYTRRNAPPTRVSCECIKWTSPLHVPWLVLCIVTSHNCWHLLTPRRRKFSVNAFKMDPARHRLLCHNHTPLFATSQSYAWPPSSFVYQQCLHVCITILARHNIYQINRSRMQFSLPKNCPTFRPPKYIRSQNVNKMYNGISDKCHMFGSHFQSLTDLVAR